MDKVLVTLKLSKGEVAVSPKGSSSSTKFLCFLFFKRSFLHPSLSDGFHAAYEVASEIREDPLHDAMKSSKYMVQPLSSDQAEPSIEKKPLFGAEEI